MGSISRGRDYKELVREIKQRVHKAQYEALKAVNKELIALYWDIGRMIVERQKRHGWGKSIVESLARDLRLEFPGVKGFSTQNLWRMRLFYLVYKDNPKLSPMVREIGWSHNIIIPMPVISFGSRLMARNSLSILSFITGA